jgi:hypothetical protein
MKNIILALGAFVLVGLLILWFINGGGGRAYNGAKNFSFFSTTTNSGRFALPWQSAGLLPRIEIKDTAPELLDEHGYAAPETALAELQREYESLVTNTNELTNIGVPSPSFKKVTLRAGFSTRESSPAHEEVTLQAAYENTAPVSLAGWTLQSALTGNTATIPTAASPFWMGAVNTLSPISLEPGYSAVVISGVSPVGVSFRENMCSGYLSQFQSFTPPLSLQCPTPEDEVSLSIDSLTAYGPECIDAVRMIPTCEFPKEIPRVSSSCRAHLQSLLSYNGCLKRHASDSNFSSETWRLFLGSHTQLWHDTHDAVRLLDAEGRVVDVLVY